MYHINGLSTYAFLWICNSIKWPNSAHFRDIMLRNPSDLDLDLSRSLKVKSDSVIGLPIYGFLLVSDRNIWPSSAPIHRFEIWVTLTQGQMWCGHWTLHTWFPIYNHIFISHRLALMSMQKCFLLSLIIKLKLRLNANAPNDLKMTLSVSRSKVCHIRTTSTYESQISLRFALRSLVFQTIVRGF